MTQLYDIIKTLQEEYKHESIVPVIGAGFSMPFSLPNWSNLLLAICKEFHLENYQIEAIKDFCENGDYIRAVDMLVGFTKGEKNEKDIQLYVAKIISEKLKSLKQSLNVDSLRESKIQNNYVDIFKHNFKTILTLNYDEILADYASNEYSQNTITNFKTPQEIGKGKNIFYVHGRVSDPESIILAKANYSEVYSDNNFRRMFSALTLNRTFLFLGFSFQDDYIKKFLETVTQNCNVKHYALMDASSVRALGEQNIAELNEKYCIKIIQFDEAQNGYIKNISNFLNVICNSTNEGLLSQTIYTTPIPYKNSGKRYLTHSSVYLCLQNNLLKLIDLIKPHSILELGFGGAQTAVKLAEHGIEKITVVNHDDDMIATAKSFIQSKNLKNIELKQKNAKDFVKNDLTKFDFIFMLYNFHHIPDLDAQRKQKIQFLRDCYDNMGDNTYLCIADDFLPEKCSEDRLETDRHLSALYTQRSEEYKASTFWSFLSGISPGDIFRATEESEQSRIRELESGVKVQTRDGEYLVKKSWLHDLCVEIGFSAIIDKAVNNIGDAILLLKK